MTIFSLKSSGSYRNVQGSMFDLLFISTIKHHLIALRNDRAFLFKSVCLCIHTYESLTSKPPTATKKENFLRASIIKSITISAKPRPRPLWCSLCGLDMNPAGSPEGAQLTATRAQAPKHQPLLSVFTAGPNLDTWCSFCILEKGPALGLDHWLSLKKSTYFLFYL